MSASGIDRVPCPEGRLLSRTRALTECFTGQYLSIGRSLSSSSSSRLCLPESSCDKEISIAPHSRPLCVCEKETEVETDDSSSPRSKVGHRALLVRDPLKIYKYALPAAALLDQRHRFRRNTGGTVKGREEGAIFIRTISTHTHRASERTGRSATNAAAAIEGTIDQKHKVNIIT